MDYVQFYFRSPGELDPDRRETEEYVQSLDIFDGEVLNALQREQDIIERIILTHILESFGLEIDFEYVRGVAEKSGAAVYIGPGETQPILFVDMVLDKSMICLFLTVLSACYHPQELEKYRSIFRFFVRDVLVDRKETDSDWDDIIKEMYIDDRAITQAYGIYWAFWTFMVGHEIYHIANPVDLSTREDEFLADRFGFQVLIRFIQEQKTGMLPKELDCFYEEYYLVPCMLMEFIRNMDLYREKMPAYGRDDCHPSPEERIQALIDLFDTDVPDDMDTEYGNAFLNAFLDAVELFNGDTAE